MLDKITFNDKNKAGIVQDERILADFQVNQIKYVVNDAVDEIENISKNMVSKDSPAFTGTPTAPTASQGTNNTQIATTEFVRRDSKVANILSNVTDFNDVTSAGLFWVHGTDIANAPVTGEIYCYLQVNYRADATYQIIQNLHTAPDNVLYLRGHNAQRLACLEKNV